MRDVLCPYSTAGGYLLLEVVLALAIFIVAVVGLLSCLNSGLDADYAQRRQTNMRLNLQSLLDDSLATVINRGRTEFAEDAYHIRYRREVVETNVALKGRPRIDGLLKVSIEALDTRQTNKVIGELWTYVSS